MDGKAEKEKFIGNPTMIATIFMVEVLDRTVSDERIR